MPLPTDPNEPWPPKTWAPIAADIEEASVWYGGDEDDLEAFYGRTTGQAARPSERTTGRNLLDRVRFWARRSDDRGTNRQRLHAPAAADVAAAAADLLFGDEPRFVIPEAHEFDIPDDPDTETEAEPSADPAAMAAEERLAELADVDGWASTLIEAAEVCSGLGLVFLRPVWDPELADHPMLNVVHADHAVPEFRLGQLTAVTFWRVLEVDGKGAVWRHLERYERGTIVHRLYVGTDKAIGSPVSLDRHTATEALAVADDGTVDIPDGLKGELLVRAIPNALNRKHRQWPVGRADTAGTEPLMDALDEAWTSLARDIRLGKGRVIVPQEFLDRPGGRGEGVTFDLDNEVFSPLNMDPANMERAGITVSQFAIRAEEHLRVIAEMFRKVVDSAGYSPQSFGLEGDGAEATATEVIDRKDKSHRTTARKQRMWRRNVEDIAFQMLVIDAELFGSGVEPMRPRLVFTDPDEAGPREIGSTLNLLKLAEAASIETRVRMLHRDWDEPEVQAEVKRLRDELGVGDVPEPTGGLL